MKSIAKTLLLGAVCAASVGLMGCEVGYDPGYRRVEVVDDSYAPPPVVYETYYYDGYYDGPYYRYRDREGHWLVERREVHDRRVREFHDYQVRHPSDVRARNIQEHQNYSATHTPAFTESAANRGAMRQAPNHSNQSSGRSSGHESSGHDSRGHDEH